MTEFVLTLSCEDRIGIVHAVSGFLVDHACNIVDSAQFGDPDTRRFFGHRRCMVHALDVLFDDRADFVAIGRDIENMVPARAVKFHVAQRVLPNGPRTVVFR